MDQPTTGVFADYKRDSRPQNGGWAPGNYCCACVTCQAEFIGDKRAAVCADCAYDPTPKRPELTSHVCDWMIHQFSQRWASKPSQQ